MRVSRRAALIVLWAAYALDWTGGAGGHLLFGGTPPNLTWAAPAFLVLASLLVIVGAPEDWRALWISFVAGFIAEAIGVATGYPFGGYSYTHVLAPQWLGVPIVMAGAWMILSAWVRQMRLPVWGGALVLVLIDFVIDPLASHTLGFWRWQTAGPYYGVPTINFVGWFVVSLLILLTVPAAPHRNPNTVAAGFSILLFFTIIGFAHAFLVPASLGLALCGAGYWRWRSSIVSTRIWETARSRNHL